MLEELGQPYEAIPVDTAKGEQHAPAFRAINPNGKVPAIVDADGPEKPRRGCSIPTPSCSTSAKRRAARAGTPADRPDLLSWLFFIATGLGPFSGQAVHFQGAKPEKVPAYAVNRYRREVERHYRVLDRHLAGREHIVGAGYTIVDMCAWGWLSRAPIVLPGEDDPLTAFPNVKRLVQMVDARPAAARAKAVGKDHPFKREVDEDTRRAMFPSNYLDIAM